MNAISKASSQVVALPDSDAVRILQNSLYPGAKDESVRLVLAWCRATGRDPMRKPIHIVGMSVKIGRDKYEWRDVLMPGIGTYRTDAARTGEYAGKSEPEFGPDETRTLGLGDAACTVTFPKWCRVTVRRLVGGQVRDFTALEYWIENYATGHKTDAPNAMWRKRPYGQLAKCCEAQALRMAFPEETGNTNTSEEMEGKAFEGTTLDARPEPEVPQTAIAHQPASAELVPSLDEQPPRDAARDWASKLIARLGKLEDSTQLMKAVDWAREDRDSLRQHRPELSAEVEAAFSAAYDRLMKPLPGEGPGLDENGEDEGLALRHKPTPGAGELDDEIPF